MEKAVTLVPKLSVLIAENNPEVVEIYKKFLENRGHKVTLTKDGEDCLKAYKTALEDGSFEDTPYDVVLLDQRMPLVSGINVAKEIRTLVPDQKIVFSTAYPDDIQESLEDIPGTYRIFPKFASLKKFYESIEA